MSIKIPIQGFAINHEPVKNWDERVRRNEKSLSHWWKCVRAKKIFDYQILSRCLKLWKNQSSFRESIFV